MFMRLSFLIVAAGFLTGSARAAEPKPPTDEELKAAHARVTDYLKAVEGADAARVTPLAGDGLFATFPDHVLFAVMFPQYPVARLAPAPFAPSNVVAVLKKDGKPVLIPSAKELEAFFKASARPVKTEVEAEEALKAFLRASAELSQDGFYKFTVKTDDKPKVDGGAVTGSGRAVVAPEGGNKGEITAALAFKDGKLTAAETKVNVTPGIRPRCQATKLLDTDPIVREMAEQSIRVMGSAAKPYLDEQRAKASPELQKAIDRVWARIVAEGR
ncbi:Marine sediment metagenome DNA, contig: S01H1_S00224 (Fragment) OS=marine sediment metagenome GN=S01H1_24902 PE=4 SV=1 [Gemmataceae bacterium]